MKLEPHILYVALLERDRSYHGRVYVCVTTTGIFCRLSCPARKPRFENCEFRRTVRECLAEGYRPCKRCHPLAPSALSEPRMQPLVEELMEPRPRRWSESELKRLGYDPSTVRRWFKRQFGSPFLALSRRRRLRAGFAVLQQGGSVIDAQLVAGFESPAAFRSGFHRELGCAPSRAVGADAAWVADWFSTRLGDAFCLHDNERVRSLVLSDSGGLADALSGSSSQSPPRGFVAARTDFGDRVRAWTRACLSGGPPGVESPPVWSASDAAQRTIQAIRAIRPGRTLGLSELAVTAAVSPELALKAARDPTSHLIVPSHRLLDSEGARLRYTTGLWELDLLEEVEQNFRATDQKHT